MQQQVVEQIKTGVDVVAIGTVTGTLMAWLPPVAAAFTIVWTGFRIYETKTVQGWVHERRDKSTGKGS